MQKERNFHDLFLKFICGIHIQSQSKILRLDINPLNAELNPICHLLALLGGATIVVVSRLRVNVTVHIRSCSR